MGFLVFWVFPGGEFFKHGAVACFVTSEIRFLFSMYLVPFFDCILLAGALESERRGEIGRQVLSYVHPSGRASIPCEFRVHPEKKGSSCGRRASEYHFV